MQIIPMRELKNTVEIERRCAEENGPVFHPCRFVSVVHVP